MIIQVPVDSEAIVLPVEGALEEKIYPGGKITQLESDLAILATALRHRLTAAAIDDVCHLVNLHTPENSRGVAKCYNGSGGLRAKYTDEGKYVMHFMCPNCNTELETAESACHVNCTVKTAQVSCFIEYKIEKILEDKFNDPNFPELIRHKMTRKKRNQDAIEDVYDSRVFQRLPDLQNYGCLGVGLNTDGVPLFKKSNFSIWPIFMVYYDLPPNLRYKYQHLSLVGLWLSAAKPFMNTFLEPICRSITESLTGCCRLRDQN
eukprot:Pompholyxophrys_punicea_v1_NODE_663_length_1496_cov_5.961138.p1 type:complete len:262 gc:universal NODE_663_length_1496_cov_5.961138:348-1133(+)